MFLSITLGIYSWKGTCNCFLLPLTNTHIHLHVHILTHTETHTIPSTRGRQLFNSFSIAAISSSRSITVSAGIYSSLVLIMKMWYCTLKPCGYSWPIDFCSVMVYRRREAASSSSSSCRCTEVKRHQFLQFGLSGIFLFKKTYITSSIVIKMIQFTSY